MDLILLIYFVIALIHGAIKGLCFLMGDEDYGWGNFWDWFIYNLFWIILPIKSIIKYFTNL